MQLLERQLERNIRKELRNVELVLQWGLKSFTPVCASREVPSHHRFLSNGLAVLLNSVLECVGLLLRLSGGLSQPP
eukprot:scaffold176553_cov22-Tisochrysis_lutea.AAC.2